MTRELLMMLLADGRLPIGGHTQSAGLEPAALAGLVPEDVPRYIEARLRTVVIVDAATAVVSRATYRQHLPLEAVIRAWDARTPSPAVRSAARVQGRTTLRLATRLWPSLSTALALRAAPRPVVVGAIAAEAGLGAHEIATLVAYDDVQTVGSAALKLFAMDPATSTEWAFGALPAIQSVATSVASMECANEIPACSGPQIELWAQEHARSSRRLFSA